LSRPFEAADPLVGRGLCNEPEPDMTFLSPALPGRAEAARSLSVTAETLAAARFDTLETRLETDSASYWAWMRPGPKPSFTPELLEDILAQQALARAALEHARETGTEPAFRWYIFGSRIPGIFNLGGDLALFADRIRAKDAESLRQYGYSCVEAILGGGGPFSTPVTSIALVQGDALGGGFECALAGDIIIAERSARFGLPEILFNLFPGMGAYSFLSRRLGTVEAERIITSGRVYTAEEMHAIGVVDLVAEDGQGEAAVRAWMDRHARRHNAMQAIHRIRRRVNPVTLQELRDIVDIWTETAMNLAEADLRKMLRLAQAQEKRLAQAVTAAAPAFATAAE
jgi:DSF synthase